MISFFDELRLFRKRIVEVLTEIKLTQRDKDFFHETFVPNATYSPWKTDQEFFTLYNLIKERTLVDIYRAWQLWNLVIQVNHLKGDVLEVGVWKGGTAAIIGRAAAGIGKAYFADTFEGVVKTGEFDTYYKGGEHAYKEVSEVEQLLNENGVNNCRVLKGIFPDDFSDEFKNSLFRFCHIDVDVYQSGLEIFNYIWPKLIVGGVIVFDDYGFLGCEGITRLVNGLKIENGIVNYNLSGQAVIIKCGS
jgi:O-methyltransferase